MKYPQILSWSRIIHLPADVYILLQIPSYVQMAAWRFYTLTLHSHFVKNIVSTFQVDSFSSHSLVCVVLCVPCTFLQVSFYTFFFFIADVAIFYSLPFKVCMLTSAKGRKVAIEVKLSFISCIRAYMHDISFLLFCCNIHTHKKKIDKAQLFFLKAHRGLLSSAIWRKKTWDSNALQYL